MTSSLFTPQTLIALRQKHGKGTLFQLDVEKARVVKSHGSDTSYIPFTCLTLSGGKCRLVLKINKQITASSAKFPGEQNEENAKKAKDVRICYRKLEQKDLEPTDHKEEKRADLLKANDEFIQACDIIDEEYTSMVENQLMKYRGSKFQLQKNKTINRIKQSERKAHKVEIEEDEKRPEDERIVCDNMIKLPHPLYRFKLTANDQTKKIGKTNYNTKEHEYIVYDLRKSTKENKFKSVVAKLKDTTGKLIDLTVTNVKTFITYMSLTAGIIDFDNIIISKSGISLSNKYKELHVWPHKVMKSDSINDEDREEIIGMGCGSADDTEVIEEPVVDYKSTRPSDKSKSKKNNAENEDFMEDLPLEDMEITTTNKKSKTGKSTKKSYNKSDSDIDTDEERGDDTEEQDKEEQDKEDHDMIDKEPDENDKDLEIVEKSKTKAKESSKPTSKPAKNTRSTKTAKIAKK